MHPPFRHQNLCRAAALFLAAVLFLPNSAFSLRGSIENGTPARLAQGLGSVLPSKLAPAAGLEEVALLPFLEAHRQIEGFLKGMQQGMRESGGYQSAAVVDLRGLVDKKVIFVGDMHGYGGVLERVLEREDMEDEKTVLILMGDAVHREEEQDWLEMDSSIRQVQKAMELKIRYPRRVYYLLGNHDRPTLTVKRSLRKGGRPYEIGKAYFEKLREHYGPEYVEKYKRFLAQSPLLVIGDGWAAVHAGPIGGATLDQIRKANVASILDPLKEMDPIVDQAVNGREYYIDSVKEFLQNLGLPLGSRLVTSHYHLRTTWWHRKLLAFTQDPDWVDVVHNIYAGERSRFGRWGYARYQNGALELVKFIDREPEREGIDRYAVPQDRLHPPPAGGLEEPGRPSEEEFLAFIRMATGQRFSPYFDSLTERYSAFVFSGRNLTGWMNTLKEAGRLIDENDFGLNSMVGEFSPGWAQDEQWQPVDRRFRYGFRESIRQLYQMVLMMDEPQPTLTWQQFAGLSGRVMSALLSLQEELISMQSVPRYPYGLTLEEWDRLLLLQKEVWELFGPTGSIRLPYVIPVEGGLFGSQDLLEFAATLKTAGVTQESVVFDAGHGTGLSLGVARTVFGAGAIGYERHPTLNGFAGILHGKLAENRNWSVPIGNVQLYEDDFLKARLLGVTHVAVFPTPGVLGSENEQFERWVDAEAAPGTRVIMTTDERGAELNAHWPTLTRRWRADERSVPRAVIFTKPATAGLEEQAVFAAAREILESLRSAIETPGVAVIGESVAGRFLEFQVLAGLEEQVVIERDPAETVIRLAERGITHVQYFGRVEEAGRFTAAAGPLGIRVIARSLQNPTSRLLLHKVLVGIGVPEGRIASGLEELDRNLTELGQAA